MYFFRSFGTMQLMVPRLGNLRHLLNDCSTVLKSSSIPLLLTHTNSYNSFFTSFAFIGIPQSGKFNQKQQSKEEVLDHEVTVPRLRNLGLHGYQELLWNVCSTVVKSSSIPLLARTPPPPEVSHHSLQHCLGFCHHHAAGRCQFG